MISSIKFLIFFLFLLNITSCKIYLADKNDIYALRKSLNKEVYHKGTKKSLISKKISNIDLEYKELNNDELCQKATIIKNKITFWYFENTSLYVKEAKRRNLNCGVGIVNNNLNKTKNSNAIDTRAPSSLDLKTITCELMPSTLSCRYYRQSLARLCETIRGWENKRGVTHDNYHESLKEVKRRGAYCNSLKSNKKITKVKNKKKLKKWLPPCSKTKRKHNCFGTLKYKNGDIYTGAFLKNKRHGLGTYIFKNKNKYVGEFKRGKYNGRGTFYSLSNNKFKGYVHSGMYSNNLRNGYGITNYPDGSKYMGNYLDNLKNGYGSFYFINGNKYVGEFKKGKYNGLGIFYFKNGQKKEGVWKKNKFIYAKKIHKKINKDDEKTQSFGSVQELRIERKKRKELEKKLAILESKLKAQQKTIYEDKKIPLIKIFSSKTEGKRGIISGVVKDDVEVAELLIEGKSVFVDKNGHFKYKVYVPPIGLNIKIEAFDRSGLSSSKIIKLTQNKTSVDTSIIFEKLNPLNKRVEKNKNALALIVGISKYENTKSKALFADNDALVFKDYATEKLGVSENRVKILLNYEAKERNVLLAIKEWLIRSTKNNKSDIYIFFAGHGLSSSDGNNMYLLPHDGSPRLLQDTAILRKRLFDEVKNANPRSVTIFLDTCYSGSTRDNESLIVSRPIALKSVKQNIPNNFTVFTAASGSQTSNPLFEVRHGLFSYFLMKGMEGAADTNNDNKITSDELHLYVQQNVIQQSSGAQTPQLLGVKNNVLVKFK